MDLRDRLCMIFLLESETERRNEMSLKAALYNK